MEELSVCDMLPYEQRPRNCARYCSPGRITEVEEITDAFVIHRCPICKLRSYVPLPDAFTRGEMDGELPGPDLSEAHEHDWRLF